ncbi:HAMP domain-containing sensor histidine kinase [Pseudomonas paraveronii]|uniref:sensor histidine kinase n=1 Tax=Pseudomonas paraveronii TaxID=3040598 RepID=UPI002AB310C1|nr:HAMP domain-containing sensor histidine kinase [Pseudomonas sp. FLM 11]
MSDVDEDKQRNEAQRIDLLFLGNFVHQLVNPLNGVAGTLDNVVEGVYKGAEINQKINAARAQIEQCIHLTKNLAFFSEISSEQKILSAPKKEGVVILPQSIIEALQFYAELGAKRSIKIGLMDKVTQYKIKGRPEALRQVFMNLFDNAVKYGLSNTTITVTPSVQKKTGALRVLFENHSIGFSSSDAENIFLLGFRSVEAKSSIALSTGLGLYLCREIMRSFFNGDVIAGHSKKRGISTFTVIFPKGSWYLS